MRQGVPTARPDAAMGADAQGRPILCTQFCPVHITTTTHASILAGACKLPARQHAPDLL